MRYETPEWYQGSMNPYYAEGVFLKPGEGNNGFSLDRKGERQDLRVTPLAVGSFAELELSDVPALQDFDEDTWVECPGLKSALLSFEYGVPIYFFDNHNHAFYGWCEALKAGWISPGDSLVHIDAHFDDADPPHMDVDIGDLQSVWDYTQHALQIATFIKPALKMGIFSDLVNLVETPDFEHFEMPKGQIVMDIDLDVFCEEMRHISWQQKVEALKACLPQTALLTVATSPFFIDQEKALAVWSRLCGELFEPILDDADAL